MIAQNEHTPIPGFSGYAATWEGRIFSVEHNWRGYGVRELIQDKNADGYPSVRLTINGKRFRIAVHRLIAAAFLPGRPSPDHEIRHLNGDKTDCCADNLHGERQKRTRQTVKRTGAHLVGKPIPDRSSWD